MTRSKPTEHWLRAAGFARAPAPSPIVSPVVDKSVATAILKQAAASSTMLLADRLAFCRDSLKQLSKDSYPEQWGMLHLPLAVTLIERNSETRANDDDLNEVAASLRRALEVYKPKSNSDLWADRSRRWPASSLRGQSVMVKVTYRLRKNWCENLLSHVIAACANARTAFKAGTFDWSRIMADLGDSRLSVDPEAAVATYTEMLSMMENTPPLTNEEYASDLGGALGELSIRAIAGIQSIERLKGG